MFLRKLLLTLGAVGGALAGCRRSGPAADPAAPVAAVVEPGTPLPPRTARALAGYRRDLRGFAEALAALRLAVDQAQPPAAQRAAFGRARLAWKQVEWLAEYYSPGLAKQLNGPALPEVEEFDGLQRPLAPEGLQVVETYFYPEASAPARRAALRAELDLMRSTLVALRNAAASLRPTDAHVFDAARLEIFRVLSLGLAGFDTPASPGAVPEAETALAAVQAALHPFMADLRQRRPALADSLAGAFARSRACLRAHPAAAGFDRLRFFARCASPLTRQLKRAQAVLAVPFFDEARALRADAATLFDADAFRPAAFAANTAARPTAAQAALGRLLFFDPALSGNGQRSCAGCHRPERAFTDGRARSLAFAGRGHVARNAPTLLNAALQRTQFHDGRAAFLEDQAAAVLANAAEMHGSLEAAACLLGHSPAYRAAFGRAFGAAAPVAAPQLKTALAAYVRSLTRLGSPFDRYQRGDTAALPAAAQRGFNLFMGKAKCGTCHFVPLFNGTVPPGFERSEAEVLGVPARGGVQRSARPDLDPGRYGATGVRLHRGAFKTPTLRNVALTAPYMHNGAYATLEQVVDFYNEGGGAGLGLDVPNQTLPADKLRLSASEKQELVAFLRALTDTSGLSRARPRALPPFAGPLARLNARPVGGRY